MSLRFTSLVCTWLLTVGLHAQTYYDGIRVCWDFHTRQFLNAGVYSRVKQLSDGTLACAYSAGDNVYLRTCRNGRWGAATLVAKPKEAGHYYTNSELLELADGRLMYAWNARAREGSGLPYKIMAAYSSTRGSTWQDVQDLYVAGTTGSDGCWEPAMMQLPSGEVQMFFANEHNVPNSDQNITLLRSTDNCATWAAPEVVSFRQGARDGMPVPVCLQDGKGLAFAIEDNGLNGTFKPVTIHSTLQDNWRSGTVTGSSAQRRSALAQEEQLAASVYAGAPYLVQLRSGETLLSCQSSEGRQSADHALMQVYVGDSLARDFRGRSTPFPFDHNPDAKTLWCSMTQTDDSTVTATSSISGLTSQNGIWTVNGHIVRPISALHAPGGPREWQYVPMGMFIGAESQAQAQIRTAWDDDSLYLCFHVTDRKIVTAEGGNVWDSDGVEFYMDKNQRGITNLLMGMYKILVNVADQTLLQRASENRWVDWTAQIGHAVERNAQGYRILISLPWRAVGGKPKTDRFTIFFKLHNNDGDGTVYHENMSGGHPDKPNTWLRCTLSGETVTGIRQAATPRDNGSAETVTHAYLPDGRKVNWDNLAAPHGLYIIKGKKVIR
ncbi:MAG: exo-alpha-sialidase [Bacteroidaceae bacterium]|nr:exo-alpha-sialidase [Bacteroidaceae bacterium]